MLVALYGLYELVRGARNVPLATGRRNADDVVSLERALHVYWEPGLQRFAERIPILADVLAWLYPMLHVGVSLGVLVWVYRRRRSGYPMLRAAVVTTTAFALVGYLLFPVAPPRLAVAGMVDTVSDRSPFDLGSRLLGRFYNPLAAVPSLHFAYALLAAGFVFALCRSAAIRVAAALYPLVALLVIVATGNHFVVDAAAGVAVTAFGVGTAWLLVRASRRSVAATLCTTSSSDRRRTASFPHA